VLLVLVVGLLCSWVVLKLVALQLMLVVAAAAEEGQQKGLQLARLLVLALAPPYEAAPAAATAPA
jgi:hypothetical protein